jgi:Reverse transcriptase (RNA-dependent DNA polymerase)
VLRTTETFSPVLDYTTIRIALALAQIQGSYVHHMDVSGAFLYANLEEELFMEQPKGLEVTGMQDKVFRLSKSLYGLKQAPRVWYEHLTKHLATLDSTPLNYADSAFKRSQGKDMIILYVYVDDMLLITTS